jgi:hypothetical protein
VNNGVDPLPKGTPADIVQRLNAEVVRIGALPDVRARLEAQGLSVTPPPTPDAFAAVIKADYVTVPDPKHARIHPAYPFAMCHGRKPFESSISTCKIRSLLKRKRSWHLSC